MAKTEIAVKENAALALMADMEADAGSGFENVTTKDVAIPYLSLAQATSPRVKRGEKQIPGLAEGDFLNTATMEIFKAGTFRVVPCGFQKRYIERDGTGADAHLIAVHEDEAILKQCTKDDKGKDRMPNGNVVSPTAMHFVLIVKEDGSYQPGVISLSSTQLKKSKNWLSVMQGLTIKNAAGKMIKPAMFSHSYAVGTTTASNDQGSWQLWDFSAPKPLESADIYAAAKAFCAEINKGTVKVAEPIKEDAPEGGTSDHF